MADAATGERLKGQCLCGAVNFTAVPQGGMHACHCDYCRRWTGGVYLSVECGDSVEVADTSSLGIHDSSEWADRRFCKACGTSLFWTLKAGGMTAVSVQAFDDPSQFVFENEIYIDSKPANYAFEGERPRLTGAEVEAMFAGEA